MKTYFLSGIIAFVITLFSVNGFSAPVFPDAFQNIAAPGEDCAVSSDTLPNFCDLFKKAVTGCCPIRGLSMQHIYQLMVATYGDLQNACDKNAGNYGNGVQACIDQWNCYWKGGKDSQNQLCSGTGKTCGSL